MTTQSFPNLNDLEQHDDFIARHIGVSAIEQSHMLNVLGANNLAGLLNDIVPSNIRRYTPLNLPNAVSEPEAITALRAYADKIQCFKNYIGMGYYANHTPAVVQRNVLENPAWYTAYTPYQPEISQGRLEAILNFQQMVTDLTGMDIANGSMLDEATAAAEAITLALRAGKVKSNVFLVANDVLPQTLEVLKTRATPLGIEIRLFKHGDTIEPSFGVLLQYPSVNGDIHDYGNWVKAYKAQGGTVIVAADLLALVLLKAPGEWGADIVVGNSQRFGVPLGFGGPHAGFLACKDAYKRQMPGRLVGVSVDRHGNTAYRLALQTREQHIRREKATSNICTAQVLLAVMASMYAVYHGPAGLKKIAQRVHRLTSILAAGLRELGVTIVNQTWFDTLTLQVSSAESIHAKAHAQRINLRTIDATHVGISLDETTTREDIATLLQVFGGKSEADIAARLDLVANNTIHEELARTSPYLTHPVFNRYHTETEMLRYLRSLADKDIALDRAMIPLGSCTMKLNATSEMLPVTWQEFSNVHPFAPLDQTVGYRDMIVSLEKMLCEATGYAAISLQPNAGSQGEYAGLLIIQAYHRSRGETNRNICLIPSSAHGTNPASAQMVGMQVVVVACDELGNVDVADLRAKAEQYSSQLAALMITYPSTHGVFETAIVDICDIIHAHGGQVYIDGANLNALVGLAQPGKFGGDVSHLNLHKTFCIPHGGGGPGVGPVAVASHLAPFLPGHHLATELTGETRISAVSAAPYGSASILPISWMYITMMGAEGLTQATAQAILSANYIAKRLGDAYPVLYTGKNGLVAHECILDLRPLKDATGISNEDVAKRLIDYGFHAPTMSFPVPGTLMIEPTESESLAELDRFIDAMLAIRAEIDQVAQGVWPKDDNPLVNAPHTAADVLQNEWTHAYSREVAAYPVASLRQRKYWVPVGRVDNVYGDRNLVCSCPPMSDYE